MFRTIFGIAVAGFIVAMVPGHAQAAPAAPLPAGIVADEHHVGCRAALLA